MKNRKMSSRIVVILLMLGLLLTACGGPVDPTTKPSETTKPSVLTRPAEITYSVSLSTDNGKALQGVGVWIYTDSSMTEMIWFDKTNAEGKMSFVAKESDQYVLALQDVPEGYEVETSYPVLENTEIVLKTVIVPGTDISKADLDLGDVMVDFSVTTVDGTTLNLVDMLAQKKAIVLNFYYNECAPCKMEFPLLQSAYAQYKDDLVVLAMNPINTDAEAVKALAADLGLTFPMALCEFGWENALDLQAYPTTVVIDRYGIISLIHGGGITDVRVFEDVFAFFTADDYVQTVVTDINEIAAQPVEGSKESPIVLGSIQEFSGTVEAGQALYYQLYKVSGMILEIRNPYLWVEYEGEKHYAENGVVSLKLNSPDVNTPVELAVGNAAGEAQTFHATLTYPAGTGSNPIVLTEGPFTTHVEKGNDQGVWYVYTAPKTGTLYLSCLGATDGVEYMFSAYNISSGTYYAMSSEELSFDATQMELAVEVTAGDELQITVGTLPDAEYNYPAAEIEMLLSCEEPNQGGEDPGQGGEEPLPPTPPATVYTYTVTILDDAGNPVPGVNVMFSAIGDSAMVQTDASGVASFKDTSTEIGIMIEVLPGYTAPKTEFVLTPDKADISVTFTAMEQEREYTELYVGNAYHVTAGDSEVDMDPASINYFLFIPEEAGVYRISTSQPEAILSYWGGNLHFITEQTASTDYADNSFTINVKEGALGHGHILGITGAGNCCLTIQRISDPILDETDAPWDLYEPKTPVVDVTVEKPADKTLTYVDISGNAADYVLCYNDQTGYYHLGSLEGPVVYVNLRSAQYLSFSALIQKTGLHVYYFAEDGAFINKVDFTPNITDYVAHMDSTTGLYPLNDDLIHIIKECGNYSGWWDPESHNYLLLGVAEPNPEIAWMFICCYFA